MFNFRNRDAVVPSLISIVAVLLLAATFTYMVVVPPPSAAGIAKGRIRSRQQVQTEIDQAKERSKKAEARAQDRYWTGDPDHVLADVLAELTKKTNAYKLSMAAFRPQRPRVFNDLTEVPCTVQITGPYPTIVAFIGSLDRTNSRLAVRSTQVSAADGTTGQATAVLGFSLYVADRLAPSPVEEGGSHG